MSGALSALRRMAGIQPRGHESTLASAVHQERRYVLCVDIMILIALLAIAVAAAMFWPRQIT